MTNLELILKCGNVNADDCSVRCPYEAECAKFTEEFGINPVQYRLAAQYEVFYNDYMWSEEEYQLIADVREALNK